jgi:hypothetical protein
VKAVSGATQNIITAKVGTVLISGDSVRTGARSAAGVTFGDGTTLRIGELSEVTVRPGRFHDVRLASGSVFGDFKGPGRVSGRYAVAAVRGTKVLVTTVGNSNVIAN